MKQNYETPEISVLEFQIEAIMDVSGFIGGDNNGGWLPGWNT